MKRGIVVAVIFLVVVFACSMCLWHHVIRNRFEHTHETQIDEARFAHAPNSKSCGCSQGSARGDLDPLMDPDYNMRQIAKQSILLEEHLSHRRKRCPDCISKHFMHIIGLAEEAKCLAGGKATDFPFLIDSPEFYSRLFEMWLSDRGTETTIGTVEEQLRARRKELVAAYVLQ